MEINWNQVAGEALTQILRILVPVALMLMLKWAAEFWKKLKEKNPKLAEYLAMAGELGYAAAEEYFRDQEVDGEDKLLYAIDRAEDYLMALGVPVDLKVVRDSIIQYGVTHYKFSWIRSPLQELKEISAELKEGGKENESGVADDMCVGPFHDDPDLDRHEDSERAVRPGERVAEEQNAERIPDDEQNGQAGEPDDPDGQEAA